MDLIEENKDDSKEGLTGRDKKTVFSLAEESPGIGFANIHDNFSEIELNFMQRLHLRNHSRSLKETVHENCSFNQGKNEFLSEEDELMFFEIEQAIKESDIIGLRKILEVIVAERTDFKIKNTLDYSDEIILEHDNIFNKELEEAIQEKIIIQLRDKLKSIMKSNFSHSKKMDEIDDYINGEFEQPNFFEEEIYNNPDLAKEIRLFREIDKAVAEKDIMSLRQNLRNIAYNNFSILHGFRKIGKSAWYSIAASIIIILSIEFLLHNHQTGIDQLYDKYYRPFEVNLSFSRSALFEDDQNIKLAINMSNNKEYDSAFKILSAILKRDDQNILANFYSGEILQKQGKHESAVLYFLKVLNQNDNLLMDHSRWYLGLSYIKLNKFDDAIVQFRDLADKEGFFQKESKIILRKLKQ